MRRRVIIVAVVLAVIVVGAGGTAYYLLTRLDSLVKTAIEEFGSSALGTAVSLASVEIDAAGGQGRLVGLRVANPAGFSAADALSIGETSVSMDLVNLTRDPIVVQEVTIRAPRFNYEIGPEGGNLDRIAENVRGSGAEETGGDASPGGAGARTDGEEGRTFVVRRLLIEGAEVSVTAPQLGEKVVKVALPPLELKDLGSDGAALSPEVLLETVWTSLEASAQAEFAKVPSLRAILAVPITEPVKKALEGTEETFESLGEKLKELLGD